MRYQNIQELLDNPDFRKEVEHSPKEGTILQGLKAKFPEYSSSDLEIAMMLVGGDQANKKQTNTLAKRKNWTEIKKACDQFDKEQKKPQFSVYRKPSAWKKYLKYAAIFVGFVTSFAWGVLYNNSPKEVALESPEPQTTIKSNPPGQKSRIQLPDGSVAYLNASSKLTYDQGFSGDQRKVFLSGEAFFEVAKDASRPFTVVIDNLTVTALGTEFNVNSFKKDVKVALLEGSVLINNIGNSDQMILKPSEVIRFDSKTNQLVRTSDNAEDLSKWKWDDPIIFFDNTPLTEAIEVLERWYAVNIEVVNMPDKATTVSGEFKNTSLEVVLQSLEYSLEFEFEIDAKEITLTF